MDGWKNISSYLIGSDLVTAVGSNHVRFVVGRGGKRAFKIEMQTWGRERWPGAQKIKMRSSEGKLTTTQGRGS